MSIVKIFKFIHSFKEGASKKVSSKYPIIPKWMELTQQTLPFRPKMIQKVPSRLTLSNWLTYMQITGSPHQVVSGTLQNFLLDQMIYSYPSCIQRLSDEIVDSFYNSPGAHCGWTARLVGKLKLIQAENITISPYR